MKTALLPLLALAATPACAEQFQNIPALEARVIGALGAGIGEPGGPAAPIDRRLKLTQCGATVAIEPPVMGAIALRCPSAGWRIRVPLARIGGAATQVSYGAPAKADPVIRRGDPVDLVAETAGFSVSVSATAQEDGAPGARIKIKADGQNQPIFAQVIDAGRVKLPGFK